MSRPEGSNDWFYEQDMDGGGNPIPFSYSVMRSMPMSDDFDLVATVTTENDARRIAASNHLYEALKAILWQHDNGEVLGGMTLQDARAALEMAEPKKKTPKSA